MIPPLILKECAQELSTSLCTLLNKSFTSGLIPTEWKMANITPIHKKGHKHKKENYRQVSLTPIVCKVAEKTVCSMFLVRTPSFKQIDNKELGYVERIPTGQL